MSFNRLPVVAITMDLQVLQHHHHLPVLLGGIVTAGALPLTIDCRAPRDDLDHLMGMVDGLILLGGADVNPELYGGDGSDPLVTAAPRSLDDNEITALHSALRRGLPILAVCRGAQLTNVALGGTLVADLPRDRPGAVRHRLAEDLLDRPAHAVDVTPDTRLAQWLGAAGRIEVNSMHHQGIETLAPGVRAVATADDGLVEAFEIAAANLVAVQWHPEILWANDVYAENLMRGFVCCCADRTPAGRALC